VIRRARSMPADAHGHYQGYDDVPFPAAIAGWGLCVEAAPAEQAVSGHGDEVVEIDTMRR
jgi:hypothetical protein